MQRNSAPEPHERISLLEASYQAKLEILHTIFTAYPVTNPQDLHLRTQLLHDAASHHRASLLLHHLTPHHPRPWLLPLLQHCKDPRHAAHTILTTLIAPSRRTLDLGRTVFRLFWRPIVTQVPHRRKTAHRCNAVFGFTERRHIDWELSARDLRAAVAYELETLAPDGTDYTAVLAGSAFAGFWRKAKGQVGNPEFSVGAIARRVVGFLEMKRSGKYRRVLKTRLARVGVDYPREVWERPVMERRFAAGELFCDVEEVVAEVLMYEDALQFMLKA
ncbi:hypothetical protein HDU96_000607 [Phlyctochytrium bullatum]|nr:hypothetical protein HDU96_000607 [Phlyctochytrium bullatum]